MLIGQLVTHKSLASFRVRTAPSHHIKLFSTRWLWWKHSGWGFKAGLKMHKLLRPYWYQTENVCHLIPLRDPLQWLQLAEMRQRRGLSATVVTPINQSCSSSNKLIKHLQILKSTPTSPSTIHKCTCKSCYISCYTLLNGKYILSVQLHYICADIIYQFGGKNFGKLLLELYRFYQSLYGRQK